MGEEEAEVLPWWCLQSQNGCRIHGGPVPAKELTARIAPGRLVQVFENDAVDAEKIRLGLFFGTELLATQQDDGAFVF